MTSGSGGIDHDEVSCHLRSFLDYLDIYQTKINKTNKCLRIVISDPQLKCN